MPISLRQEHHSILTRLIPAAWHPWYWLIQFFHQILRINPKILQSDILNSLCVEYEALILNVRILAAIWNFPKIPSIFFTFHPLFLLGILLFTLSVLKLIKSNLLGLSWVKADKNSLAWLEWYSAHLSSNFLIELSFKD